MLQLFKYYKATPSIDSWCSTTQCCNWIWRDVDWMYFYAKYFFNLMSPYYWRDIISSFLIDPLLSRKVRIILIFPYMGSIHIQFGYVSENILCLSAFMWHHCDITKNYFRFRNPGLKVICCLWEPDWGYCSLVLG